MIALDELKSVLNVTTDTGDADLVALEADTVAYVETATGHTFPALAEQEPVYISGLGSRNLWLPDTPRAGVDEDNVALALADSIVVEHESSPGAWTVVPASDYAVRANRLVHASRWALGSDNYRVTYWLGYPPGEEPGDIRRLVIDLITRKYKLRGHEGMKSESMGGYSYTFGDEDIDAVDGWGVIELWLNKRPVFA